MKRLKSILQEFCRLPPLNKLAIVGIFVFVFILGFSLSAVYWKIRIPQLSEIPLIKELPFVKREASLASLSLVPKSQTLKTGETFLVTITLKTGDFKVDTVDAILFFDPKVLKVEKVSEGMFFADYPIKKWENDKIFLTGTIGVEGKQPGGVQGEGAFATVTFKALTAAVAKVDFDQSSLVVIEGKNVLGETKGATFEIY